MTRKKQQSFVGVLLIAQLCASNALAMHSSAAAAESDEEEGWTLVGDSFSPMVQHQIARKEIERERVRLLEQQQKMREEFVRQQQLELVKERQRIQQQLAKKMQEELDRQKQIIQQGLQKEKQKLIEQQRELVRKQQQRVDREKEEVAKRRLELHKEIERKKEIQPTERVPSLKMQQEIMDKLGGLTNFSPICVAVFHGHADGIEEMASKRNVNDICTSYDASVLHVAAFFNEVEAVKVLLREGADKDVFTNIKFFSRNFPRSTPLIMASDLGHHQIVQLLVDEGANKESEGGEGYTALHKAADGGHLQVVKILVDAGSNPEAVGGRDFDRVTPLSLAAAGGHLQVVRFLVERNAKIEPVYTNSPTGNRGPLHYAAMGGHHETVRFLLNSGVDKDKIGYNKTALIEAVIGDNYEVVKILIENGADKNKKEHRFPLEYAKTALGYAKEKNSQDIIRLLQ